MIFKVLVNNSDNNKSSRHMLTNLFLFFQDIRFPRIAFFAIEDIDVHEEIW